MFNLLRFITALFLTVLTPLYSLINAVRPAPVSEFTENAAVTKQQRDYGEFNMNDNDIILEGEGLEEAIAKAAATDEAVTIWLKEGEYRLSKTIELSGAKNIRISTLSGENASITSGITLGNWQEDEANGIKVWSTALPDGVKFNTLFKNDQKLPVTRYPEKGNLAVGDTDRANSLFTQENSPWLYTYGDTSFFVGDDMKLDKMANIEDVRIKIMHYWFCESMPLKSYSNGRISLSHACSMVINKNDRYYLENVLEALNAPGEWYADTANNKLYYVPCPGDDIGTLSLFAPTTTKLFSLTDCSGITFNGITFKNTDWCYSTVQKELGWLCDYGLLFPQGNLECEGALEITRSDSVNFTSCDFINIGNTAVRFHKQVKSSTVKGCYFNEIGCNVVFIDGYNTEDASLLTENITVTDNHISGYGRNFPSGIAILLTFAANCELSNNEIHDGYYTAVSVGWMWGYTFHATDNIKIKNNLIYDIGQGWLSDMGGIYTLGLQPHTEITGNRIHNVAADPGEGGYGGWGIYLDEGSSGIKVRNNLVYDCGSQGFHQHYGENNLVENNIFALNRSGQLQVTRKEDHNELTLKGNIILTDGKPIYTETVQGKFIDSNNLYWDIKTGSLVFSSTGSGLGIKEKIAPSAAKYIGYYNDAIFENPLFRDAENFDFVLADNSPAIEELGFRKWNYNEAGTVTDFCINTDSDNGGNAQIPNPFVNCKSFEEARKTAGFEADFPANINGNGIRLIQAVKGSMIQAFYGSRDSGALVRKAAGSGDRSGDYNHYSQVKTVNSNGIDITLKGSNGTISLAVWNNGGYAYSIAFEKPVSESAALSAAATVK